MSGDAVSSEEEEESRPAQGVQSLRGQSTVSITMETDTITMATDCITMATEHTGYTQPLSLSLLSQDLISQVYSIEYEQPEPGTPGGYVRPTLLDYLAPLY